MIFVCMPDGIVNIYLCNSEVKSSFPKFTAVLSNKQVKGFGKHVMSVSSAVTVWKIKSIFSALLSKFMWVKAVQQIRASQWSITANLRPLTAYIYVMIIVTGGFSKKSLLLLFPRNSLEQSWTCFLGN